MSILPNFLRSLVLTVLLSFLAPVVFVTVLLAATCGLGYIPGLDIISQTGITQLLTFLAIFGSGCPVQGVMVIGFVCSLVGALFDTYAFYLYQSLNNP